MSFLQGEATAALSFGIPRPSGMNVVATAASLGVSSRRGESQRYLFESINDADQAISLLNNQLLPLSSW